MEQYLAPPSAASLPASRTEGRSLKPQRRPESLAVSAQESTIDLLDADNKVYQLNKLIVKLAAADRMLRKEMESMSDPHEIYQNVKRQEVIQRQSEAYKQERYTLQLQQHARDARFSFSPDGIENIAAVCKDIGSTTAVIAAFCASISVSILFSAVRGNLFYFYAAWWCAIIALASGLGLSVLSAERNKTVKATKGDWRRIHWGGFVVGLCLFGAIGSIVCMCYGAINLDLSEELGKNGREAKPPKLADGMEIPDGPPMGVLVVSSVIIFIICGGAFLAIFAGPFKFSTRAFWARKHEERMNLEAGHMEIK